MYKKSFEEIAASLHPGNTLVHKKRGCFVVTAIERTDNDCYLTTEGAGFSDDLSLRALYDNELIVPDGKLFEAVGKPKEELSIKTPKLLTDEEILKLLEEEKPAKPKWKPATVGKITFESYKDLFHAMDEGRGSSFSKHFWHYAPFDNAVAIALSGFFKSRVELEKNGAIPWDNVKHNETTRAVMDRNQSNLVEHYCRFFFRPKNAPSYNFVKTWRSQGQSPVLFVIDRSAIWYENPTLVMEGCAGNYSDAAFDWRKYNINNIALLKNRDFSRFDWNAIYAPYSADADEDTKIAQKSEFLIHKCLPINYIQAIYFADSMAKQRFINAIRATRPELVELCDVFPDLLWEK